MLLNNYPLTIGVSYEYTFDITVASGLSLIVFLGTNQGATYSAIGEVHETIEANGTQLYIFADGTCTIENFVIRPVLTIADNKAQNTISFSEKTRKWVSFYSYIPTNAFPPGARLPTGKPVPPWQSKSEPLEFNAAQHESTT